MKKIYTHIFIILIFIFWVNTFQAQTFVGNLNLDDKDQIQLLIFKNGDQKVGKILSIKNLDVDFLENKNSTSELFKLYDLEKIIAINEAIETYDYDNPEQLQKVLNKKNKPLVKNKNEPFRNNRLFYSETGFHLRAGESEYSTLWGVVHNYDYSLTNGLTVGMGYIVSGHFTGHLKFNYITKSLHSKFRAGFDFRMAAKPRRITNDFTNEKELKWNGYFQMAPFFSYGTANRSAHLAINIIPLFGEEGLFDGGLITFSFGGNVKLSSHWKLIYENTFGVLDSNAGSFGLFSGIGVNWFNEKNSIKLGIHPSPNFGFFNLPINDLNSTAQLPFLSYSRYFQGK